MPRKKKTKTQKKVEKVVEQISERREHPIGKRPKLQYGCEKCDGYGNIITENGAYPCACKLEYLTQARLRAANIPRRFKNKNFDNFETDTSERDHALVLCKDYVHDYSAENNRGTLIHGPPGVGKTHLIVSILRELIMKGFEGLFFNMNDLLDMLRASFDPASETKEQQIVADLIDIEILVLDDVGAQSRISGYVLDRFYSLVNGRYQNDKTLLMTTNLELKPLAQRLKVYTVSRLYEMCNIVDFPVKTDYRPEKYSPHRHLERNQEEGSAANSPRGKLPRGLR